MIRADIVPYSIPFVRPVRLGGHPFTTREGWLLRLEDEDGLVGWGEASPLPGFSLETPEAAREDLGRVVARMGAGDVHPGVTDCSSARFALELALANLQAERRGLPLAKVLHDSARSQQSLNVVLLADEPVEEAVSAVRAGFRVLKMKVGSDSVSTDAQRVRAVAQAVGDTATIRLDANRAWELHEARAFAALIRDVDIEYVEEPLADPSGLSTLASSGLPVAIDETVVQMSANSLASMHWLSAVVIKPTIVGGFRVARRIGERAIRAGIKAVISSAVETGVGLRGLAALAATIGAEDVAAGLDTARFLREDITEPPFATASIVALSEKDSYRVTASA